MINQQRGLVKWGSMSGHSKWATIHRAKEAKDAKRGAIFTKLAAQITIAVRQGGGIGDPAKNFRLRLVADKARQFNMPKDNIARAIEHGMGAGKGAELAEVVYEGFLPGGCAVMIDVLTDNKARTAQQIRMILEKSGGSLAGSGSVAYLFKPLGEIRVKTLNPSVKSIEEQELAMIDLGIDEIETDGEYFDIYCNKDKTYEFKEELEKMGYQVESAQLVMKPDTAAEIKDAAEQQKVEQTIENLEELDDVTRVWSNYQPGEI